MPIASEIFYTDCVLFEGYSMWKTKRRQSFQRPLCTSKLCFLVLTCFGCASPALCESPANDNPFGLPVPHNADRPGAVMLHGGGWSGVRDEIRQEFKIGRAHV